MSTSKTKFKLLFSIFLVFIFVMILYHPINSSTPNSISEQKIKTKTKTDIEEYVPPPPKSSNVIREDVFNISASTDDAYTQPGLGQNTWFGVSTLHLGGSLLLGAAANRKTCLRWSVPIPRDAPIISAYLNLTVQGRANYNGFTSNIIPFIINTPPFSNINEYLLTRPTTTPTRNWVWGAVTNDETYSRDITAMVQELINRPAWSNNSIFGLYIQAYGFGNVGSGEYLYFHSFDGANPLYVPKLIVKWEETPAFTATPDPVEKIQSYKTGQYLDWTAVAENPQNYTIMSNITGSMEVVENKTWTSGVNIRYNFPALGTGIYNYTIVVYDDDLRSESNSVIVNATAAPSVSLISPTAGIYGPPSLLINASIIDEESSVDWAQARITAPDIPGFSTFDIDMTQGLGNYWNCTWDNITDYNSGYYTITIRAQDTENYLNDTIFVDITINTGTPDVILISPTIGNYSSAPLFIEAWIIDVGPGLSAAKAMINASTPFNISMNQGLGNKWNCTWANISDYATGDYNITIWAINDNGDVNQNESVVIMIDLDRPSVSIVSPTSGVYSGWVTINASITDVGTSIVSADVIINSSLTYGMSQQGVYWLRAVNFKSPQFVSGDYNITIKATDDVGNVNQTVFVIITNDKDAPSVSIISPTAGPYNQTDWSQPLLINASITDVISNISSAKAMINTSTPLEIPMDQSGDYWSCTWGGIFVHENINISIAFKITIWAIDDKGNINQTVFVVITIFIRWPPSKWDGDGDGERSEGIIITRDMAVLLTIIAISATSVLVVFLIKKKGSKVPSKPTKGEKLKEKVYK